MLSLRPGSVKLSLRRILPDPVAFALIEQLLPRNTAIVLFIPADGVEHKLAIGGATVFVRLARDPVVRQLGDESRRERVQRLRKQSVGQPVTFQRAGQRGLVGN